MKKKFFRKFFCILLLTIFIPLVFALADSEGQVKSFFVDSSFDLNHQEKVSAVLRKVSEKTYFYLENEWYQELTAEERKKIDEKLEKLGQGFDETIYPGITSIYGSEWKPGIDNDYRITILFHQMKKNAGGYFNNGDEYPIIQSPNSNEREMIYLNIAYLDQDIMKSYIAHEFVHLVSFNQKERLRGVVEEIWLNEARADYAPTLLGYDDDYQNSNLQQRVRQFISLPSDSLTEWRNEAGDYGIANVFTQYLVENFGVEILVDSLQSSKIGIPSLNYALEKNEAEKDFSQIFTDWLIAIFLNDCQIGEEYCYKNQNLKNLRITPSLIFLPSTQKTDVSLNYFIKQWSGNWYRVIGGEGDLKIIFNGENKIQFKVSYILCKENFQCSIAFLELNEKQEAEISFEDFGENYVSLTLIPSIQSKISGFDSSEPLYPFSLIISMEMKPDDEELINTLKAQIAEIKAQIVALQAQIAAILAQKSQQRATLCKFETDLYFGQKNDQVCCLQEFLKDQGEEVYPEGLVTGFFGSLTQSAVIRFQEKYASEILSSLGLTKGTGFVGFSTRAKLNQILDNQ